MLCWGEKSSSDGAEEERAGVGVEEGEKVKEQKVGA